MRFRAFVGAGILVASVAVMSGEAPVAGPLFHFMEPIGPYRVGLKVVEQYDSSRTWRSAVDAMGKPYVGERARPLQTVIWYPAEKSGRKPMTVRDYSDLLATETSFDKPELSPDWKQWIDGMKPTLDDSLWAVRDAKALAGRFPLVIYAPSFTSMSWENADLCEYLASHGFVVVASPNMGENSRAMTSDVEGINCRIRICRRLRWRGLAGVGSRICLRRCGITGLTRWWRWMGVCGTSRGW